MKASPFNISMTALIMTALIMTACNKNSSIQNITHTNSTVPTGNNPQNGILDLASLTTDDGLIRLYGSTGTGSFGVPVAGAYDCDGDGFRDFAMSAMRASPLSRLYAGEVYLAFGHGEINATLDTAAPAGRILTVAGQASREASGSEIWIDDVTGDGLGDLLIARQNYRGSNPDRIGAGALTIVVGSPQLKVLAETETILDLANPPTAISLFTIVGANTLDRLGIWVRTGDIDGDNISDIVVGADQEDIINENNRGAAYIIRGGAHLAANAQIDLAEFGTTLLSGNLAKLMPPPGTPGYHFGATVNIADLNNNHRGEILIAAALNRAGARLLANDAPPNSAESQGGSARGSLYIAWDDNFNLSWPAGLSITLDQSAPGSISTIHGGAAHDLFTNQFFAEEILGGLDYNDDGEADLFIGDITATARSHRVGAGTGHIVFSAHTLRQRTLRMDAAPSDIRITTILGASSGDIASDTALHGDFNNDGIDDLGVAAPHASPQGRPDAGILYILWGQSQDWPEIIDLSYDQQPSPEDLSITNIIGANGSILGDMGDILAYSAAAGDLNNDGYTDLIVNEMLGNGVANNAVDVGNLLVISGLLVSQYKAN